MALEGLCTRLHAVLADDLRVDGTDQTSSATERAMDFARILNDRLGLKGGTTFTLEEIVPDHAGLGSGTQLGLAVGMALTKLHGLNMSAGELARLLGRGARSGIGIGVFERGGVILDGGVAMEGDDNSLGHSEDGPPPPAISRLAFPNEWRVMLILEARSKGLHGGKESDAFDALPPYSSQQAATLCRIVLMQALPALVERDFSGFSRAITALQEAVGDHFVSVQGGRYSNSRVGEVLSWLSGQGIRGYGQSSWGPTGFAFCESEEEAARMIEKTRQKWRDDDGLQFMVCGGRNHGHLIETS